MNVLDFTFNPKSVKLARQLLAEAGMSEPQITDDVGEIASILKAEIVGLENKFKTENSLARKLSDYAQEKNLPIKIVAKRTNDVLRYTYLFPKNRYAEGLNSVQIYFQEKGYQIIKIFNGWMLAGTLRDIGYRGINLTIISSRKQKFELQLHTKESFRLKTETHGLYEEFRSPNTSKQRKTEIIAEMIERAKLLKNPKGI